MTPFLSYIRPLLAYHAMTERKQCVKHQLKVLHTEGNTDDSDAEADTQRQMRQGHLDTTKDNPQHVHNDRQATTCIVLRLNVATKGPQRKHTQAHNLHTKGNTYDCKAQHEATQEVTQRENKAAEDYPNNITDKSPIIYFLGLIIR